MSYLLFERTLEFVHLHFNVASLAKVIVVVNVEYPTEFFSLTGVSTFGLLCSIGAFVMGFDFLAVVFFFFFGVGFGSGLSTGLGFGGGSSVKSSAGSMMGSICSMVSSFDCVFCAGLLIAQTIKDSSGIKITPPMIQIAVGEIPDLSRGGID